MKFEIYYNGSLTHKLQENRKFFIIFKFISTAPSLFFLNITIFALPFGKRQYD